MPHSQTFRVLFVGSLMAAMLGVVALTGWTLRPVGQRYWAVRQLVKAGEAKDPDRFLDAVQAIDKLQAGADAADDLLALTKHPDDGVRTYAIIAVAAIRHRPKIAVQMLKDVLDDREESKGVRAAAASALGRFGEDARAAVPSLVKALDPEWNSNDFWMLAAANGSLSELPREVVGPVLLRRVANWSPPSSDATSRDIAQFLMRHSGMKSSSRYGG